MGRRGARLALVGTLVALAALPWLRHGLQWPVAVGALVDHCSVPLCDFSKIYLPQAQALHAHPGQVHPKWFYPPLLAILLQPLVGLEPQGALRAWLGVEVAAALGLAAVCGHQLRRTLGGLAWPAALAAVSLSLPVVHAVKWGQVSMPIVLAVLGSLLLVGARGAGALLGAAAAVKVYPLAFLLGPLVQRRWRVLVEAGVATVLLGVALPVGMLGAAAFPFFRALASPALGDAAAPLGAQALAPTLARWFVHGTHGGLVAHPAPLVAALPAPVVAAGGLAVGLGLVGAVAWRLWRRPGLPAAEAAALVLVSVSLVLPPGWHHYFCFLPFAQAVALGRGRGPAGLAAAAWALTALPVLLLTDVPGAFFHYSAWGGTTVAALLTLGALLWPAEGGAGRG